MTYTHLIWDWNGTLFDDAGWCVACANELLARRGRPGLDMATYQEIFGFPVEDYYRRAGLIGEGESYEELSVEFMTAYRELSGTALQPGAADLLRDCRAAGLAQVVLSASGRDDLERQMGRCGATELVDERLGLDDIYAAGKTEIGRAYMARARPAAALLIGDTTHDAAVAAALGVDCVLVAHGHQSRARLAATGVPVVDDLTGVRGVLGAAGVIPTGTGRVAP